MSVVSPGSVSLKHESSRLALMYMYDEIRNGKVAFQIEARYWGVILSSARCRTPRGRGCERTKILDHRTYVRTGGGAPRLFRAEF